MLTKIRMENHLLFLILTVVVWVQFHHFVTLKKRLYYPGYCGEKEVILGAGLNDG